MHLNVRYLLASVTALLALGVSCPAAATATHTDPGATQITQIFYGSLMDLVGTDGAAFGQQFATWRGVNSNGTPWMGDLNRSDIQSVTGDHPGVSGWSFATYLSLSSADKALFVQRIKEDYNRNIILTLHWPMNNLINPNGNDNDITGMYGYPEDGDPTILERALTPNDQYGCDATLNANLDAFATFLGLLTDANGRRIPLIFRPFHEMNGKTHWWGTEGNGQQTQYIALWRHVVSYLLGKGIHQLIYCYAPGGGKTTFNEAEYLKNWPGDGFVDVCGVDQYLTDANVAAWDAKMDVVYQFAHSRGMPSALTELGPKDGLVVSPGGGTWWTSRVLANFSAWTKCAYMMTWTNQSSSSFFVGYPTQTQANNLKTFTDDSHVLLMKELPPMYGTQVVFTSNASYDGRIPESGETTSMGGTPVATDNSNAALRTGDTTQRCQYKSILSFNMNLPAGATILSAKLKLKRGIVKGTNPFNWTNNACLVEIKNGPIGLPTLQNTDFQTTGLVAATSLSNPAVDGGWAIGDLSTQGIANINKNGDTQFRIAFSQANNTGSVEDYIGWYSGDASAADRPKLEVVYQY